MIRSPTPGSSEVCVQFLLMRCIEVLNNYNIVSVSAQYSLLQVRFEDYITTVFFLFFFLFFFQVPGFPAVHLAW